MKQKDSLPNCEKEEKRARFTLLDRKPAVWLAAGAVVLAVTVTAGLTRPPKVEGAWEEMQSINLISSAVMAAEPSVAESSCPPQSTVVSEPDSSAPVPPVSSVPKPASQAAASSAASSEPQSEIHEGEPIPMVGASWDHTGRYEYVEMPVVHSYHAKFDMPSWQYGYFFSSSRELNSVLGKPEEEESGSQGTSSGPELLEVVDKTYLEVANFKYNDLLKQYNGEFFADHNLVVVFNLQGSSSTRVVPFCKRFEGGNYLFGTRTISSGEEGIALFAPHAFFFELPKEVDSSKVKIQFTEEYHHYE